MMWFERKSAEAPKGAYESAIQGSVLRDRFFSLTEEFESLHPLAFARGTAEDRLFVAPRFLEEIRHQPDGQALEIALSLCCMTRDARQQWDDEWPEIVAQLKGVDNSESALKSKGAILAYYAVNNFDAHELAKGGISEDERSLIRVEEAAIWYRLLDECAFRSLRGQRSSFVDFLLDEMAFCLGVMGSSPEMVARTISARSKEYAGYEKWVPALHASPKGTLLWEAAKHVGEPMRCGKDAVFLAAFGFLLMKKLVRAAVPVVLVGC